MIRRNESFFERHVWKVFFSLSIVITLFGLGDMLTGAATFAGGEAPTILGISGMTWEQLGAASPNAASMIDYLVRAGGAHLFILGLVSSAISWTALRRGDRWAWYVMWLWSLWMALVVSFLLAAHKQPGPGVPPPLVSGSIIFVLTVATLVLSYRKYLGNGQNRQASTTLPTLHPGAQKGK